MNKDISNAEVQKILEDYLINHLATSGDYYELGQVLKTNDSAFTRFIEEDVSNLVIYHNRIKSYTRKSEDKKLSKDSVAIYNRAVELLKKMIKDTYEKGTIEGSNNLYAREENIYNSRNYLEVPYMLDGVGMVSIVTLLATNCADMKKNFNHVKSVLDKIDFDKDGSEVTKEEVFEFIKRDLEITDENAKDEIDTILEMDIEQRKQFIRDNIYFSHIMVMELNTAGDKENVTVWSVAGNVAEEYITKKGRVCKSYADVLEHKNEFLGIVPTKKLSSMDKVKKIHAVLKQ